MVTMDGSKSVTSPIRNISQVQTATLTPRMTMLAKAAIIVTAGAAAGTAQMVAEVVVEQEVVAVVVTAATVQKAVTRLKAVQPTATPRAVATAVVAGVVGRRVGAATQFVTWTTLATPMGLDWSQVFVLAPVQGHCSSWDRLGPLVACELLQCMASVLTITTLWRPRSQLQLCHDMMAAYSCWKASPPLPCGREFDVWCCPKHSVVILKGRSSTTWQYVICS